ncbi:MAG: dTMP kinase [Candidatus Eremiobacteraeota bacterium]|nr:dTMP kinase [Candidatus Eremiobacteraeota bacterium]MBV8722566.1 dTMP kinase [Candidatus Eremiobacteraeota bacterium]
MFVTIEGIEGSGKSTLLAGLAERLRAADRDVVVTREPGGTPAGDAVRRIFLDPAIAIAPLTEAMLVNAARAQHVADVIRPALRAGKIVLCDRFVDSTLAYQGYGRGLDRDLLRRLCDAATGGLRADLTLLVDVPLAVSRARTQARHGEADRLEAEDDGFHERVRRGFLEIAHDNAGYEVLNGTLEREALIQAAYEAIGRRLGAETRA